MSPGASRTRRLKTFYAGNPDVADDCFAIWTSSDGMTPLARGWLVNALGVEWQERRCITELVELAAVFVMPNGDAQWQ
jgi:hypothetical protein